MYRSALNYLSAWKMKKTRKPLVIRGARQVGKSYLVSMFAQEHFSDYIELNFEKDASLKTLFEGSIHHAIRLLELKYNKKIDPKKTLLFLDEIQAAPEVFAKLRYFQEDFPEMPVIAAGSLLDFILERHTFSMPVGRIEYLHLGPMNFEEFLLASGQSMLLDWVRNFTFFDPVPESVHNQLISLFKTYLIIGGMPEAVSAYVETGSFHESEVIKASVLQTFRDDFHKYVPRIKPDRISNLFDKIPLLVGGKFKYVKIDKNDRAKNIADALHSLEMAKIAFLVYHSACNGLPLRAGINEKKFKVLFLDTGLMASACGMSMLDIEKADDLIMVNAGSICEQFTGQHLLYSDEFYKPPELHYWVREAKSSSAEVDYVISKGTRIVPVEVKAGKTGHLKSLHQFLKEKSTDVAVRINLDQPTVFRETNKLPTGEAVEYTLISIPFYLVGQVRRLIDDAFVKSIPDG